MGKNSSRPPGRAAAPRGRSQQFQLPDLPESVLVSILKCVRTRDRLSSCSLVCKAWAAAATVATTDLNDGRAAMEVTGPESCRGLQVWVEQFGQQVQRINLEYSRASRTESYNAPAARVALPICQLTRLESLELKNFCFMFSTQPPAPYSTRSRSRRSAGHFLTAAGGGAVSSSSRTAGDTAARPAAAAVLPELRELQLMNCWVRLDSFQQLSKLSSLTRLGLSQTDIRSRSWAVIPSEQFTAAITAVLQELTGLQELFLGDNIQLEEPEVALAPLSTMQHLQSVVFSPDACNTAALAHLPTSLTSLALIEPLACNPLFLDLAATPESLPQLTLLQDLELTNVMLQPQVLVMLSGLRNLHLESVALLLPAPPLGDDAEGEDEPQPAQHASKVALLEALGQLTQLESLTLIGLELDHLEDLELFTSLTTSTQLKDVGICGTYTSQPIPSGAIRYMLREGTQLPLLKTLELEVMDVDFSYQPPACVDTRDIKRMASCLPALEELSLIGVVQGHGAVAALTHLVPRLKRLRVSGDGFDDRGAGLVAKLTSLDTLEWTNSHVSSHGLLKLTTLTGLKSLAVRDCPMLGPAMQIETGPDAGMMERSPWEDQLAFFSSEEADATGDPDVYLQLQRHFADGSKGKKGKHSRK